MRHGPLVALVLLTACASGSSKPPPTPMVAPKPTQAATPVIAGNCSTFELPEVEAPWSTAYPLQSGTGCTVADDNIEAARTSALASLGAPGAKIDAAWDHKSDPLRLELVTKRLGLTKAEIQAIRDRGFAVLGKQSFGTYAEALHEVYQSELPLWVSTDAILHAVYRSNDTLIKRVELASLRPRLGKLLESMHCALGKMALPAEVARDADVYLTVARSLLAGTKVASVFGNASSVSGEVERLVARATAAEGIEDTQLFGRKRMVDFSVYKPRGHYDGELANYFRAASWLSRLELNLVTFDCASSSKGDPSQTPREVALAIALADLAEKSGSSELAALEQAWSLFAGKREDVPFGEIAKVGLDPVPASAERLRAAIGRRFPRTARTHFTWEGCGDLPAITTMLGARVVPDSAVTRPLVHSEVTGRQRLGIADMAYAFGLDRAKTHLAKDLADYPTLGGQLEKARTLARAKLTGEDLYSAWFSAVRAIADRPQGTLPSFMHGEAYDDLRFNSLTAGFGQIRHNYVLFAAMTYGEAGCAIPDAFVEPQVQVYDALVDYATRGEKTMHLLAMDEESGYFQRLGKNLKVLRAISARELEGKPLPDEAIRFLSMVVEITFGTRTTGSSPTFTGWYFDMFRSRDEGLDGASFLADYYTSSELSEAAYAGVSGVDIGVFVVDVGGAPRVMVGPVSHAFEAHEKLPRLTDADVPKAHQEHGWSKSYLVDGPPAPPLAIKGTVKLVEGKTDFVTLEAWSTKAIGPVTIELLDHHRKAYATITHPVGPKKVTFRFPVKKLGKDDYGERWQGLHVRAGDWDGWELGTTDLNFGASVMLDVGEFSRAFGGMPLPKVPFVDKTPKVE